MLLERIFIWIRQKICHHKFQKHYDTKKKSLRLQMCKMWKGLGDPKYLGAVRQTAS